MIRPTYAKCGILAPSRPSVTASAVDGVLRTDDAKVVDPLESAQRAVDNLVDAAPRYGLQVMININNPNP